MPKVEFLFDFGSPNAYLSHLVIPDIEKRTGRQVRLRADPARRRLQAHQQPLAGRDQSPASGTSPSTRSSRPSGSSAQHGITRYRPQPVLPGEHADDHARRRRGAEARHLRALCRRGVPAHVGRAEEARRPGSPARGADRIGAAGRSPVRAGPGPGGQGRSCWPRPSARSTAAPSARRPSSSTTRSTSARTACATSRRRSPPTGRHVLDATSTVIPSRRRGTFPEA